jgi:predicted homoserine dehydrogenase-like protein
MEYRHRLEALAKERGRNARIGLVGAGQMGRGFANHAHDMGGIDISVVADVDPGRIEQAFSDLGLEKPLISNDVNELNAAITSSKPAGTTDAYLLADLDLDVVVEATGVPEVGARVTYASLLNKKHVAVLNVEMDVTIGPLLTKIAKEQGVLYSVCHGDEPVEALYLVEFARDLSFEIVMAGKGKNNPFEPHSNPDTVLERATAKQMNPKMLCSFTDGSKTMIEMSALANATGMPLSKRGMIGPVASVKTLQNVFSPKEFGGVLEEEGVIDYCTGDVAPGVFVIVKSTKPYIAHEMSYLGMGPGPYFSLYRPYHLASVEAPITIAEMLIENKASFACETRNSEVVACTKKEIKSGEKFDGIGGYSARAVADRKADAKRDNLVPIGILQGAVAKRDLPIDHLVTYDDVELDESQTIFTLRKEMEALGL